MKCSECKGACCETFLIRTPDIPRLPGDAPEWLALHATPTAEGLEFECKCTKLTAEGRCSIYDDRPIVCRLFPAGGPDCLEAVRKRRSAVEYQRIREEGDPERIHPRWNEEPDGGS